MNGWRERIDFEFTFKWFQADFIRYLLLGAECTEVGGATAVGDDVGDACVEYACVGDACVEDACVVDACVARVSWTRASGMLRCLQLKYNIK